jgi:hypothetical protein
MQHTACRIPHITKLVKQKIFVSNPSVTGYAFREREKGSYLDFRILCELVEKAFEDRLERLIFSAFVQGVKEGHQDRSGLGASIGTASKTHLSGNHGGT